MALIAAAAATTTAGALTRSGSPSPGDVRTCSTRGDSSRPAKPPAKEAARVGPFTVWGMGVNRVGPTGNATWPYAAKMGVVLPARVRAVLSIAPESVAAAGLWKMHGGGGYVSAVRYQACRERQPARTYRGTVGRFTMFPSGIALKTPSACITVEAWVDGETAPHRATIGVGRSDC